MKFCKIENIGIGDLVIFASEQLSLDEDITVSLDSNSLKSYKSDPDAYLDFGKKFLTKLLPQKNITFTNDQNLPIYHINVGRFLNECRQDDVCNHFESIFNDKKSSIESPYVVLNTKVRHYNREHFDKNNDKFFKELNSLGIKVLLLGEREVEYNKEYKAWGSEEIYSIYTEAKTLINNELIIDKTVPKLGLTTPDIDNLFNDMSIAYQSKACINMGIGGFFCMTIFSRKLRTLTGVYPPIQSVQNIYSFSNVQEMFDSIKLLCKEKV